VIDATPKTTWHGLEGCRPLRLCHYLLGEMPHHLCSHLRSRNVSIIFVSHMQTTIGWWTEAGGVWLADKT